MPNFEPPRVGLSFEVDGVRWDTYHDLATNRFYFHNPATKEVTWLDPRVAQWKQLQKAKKRLSPRDRRLIWGVTVVPLAAAVIALSARVVYLQRHYPELLWPTKERKLRYRQRNKEKTPRSRFKISQDGKGGRSAN